MSLKVWLLITPITKWILSNDLLTTAVSPKWIPAEMRELTWENTILHKLDNYP